ncbi:MAG: septal ring lytic transglycosylase RlpA family protein [Parcubacteria group bacterium]
MFNKILYSFVIFVLGVSFGTASAHAMTVTLLTDINLNQRAVDRGATVGNGEKSFLVTVAPGVFKKSTALSIRQLDRSLFEFPQGWTAMSDVYEFQFGNIPALNKTKTVSVKITDIDRTSLVRKVFFYDNKKKAWVAVATGIVDDLSVRATISTQYGKMVVLASNRIMATGKASWYKYKNCDCAASPDYPKGTKLKVTNLDNGKSLVVRVNDFGQERDIFPDRVIDLDKVAFAKLGSLRMGILKNVKVEELD